MTEEVVRALAAVVLLLGLAVLVLHLAGVSHRWATATAVLRGALQLAVISIVLTGVISHPGWVAVALAVMFTVAVLTSTRRVSWTRHHLAITAGSMGAGVLLALGVVFGTGALDFTPRYLLAFGGIIIGGAMTVTTLAGRRLAQAIRDRWDEIEGWLALGATPRQATREIARDAIRESLIPATDQTRTTGLVTLPGAFVGAIFGGVSPVEAGLFQIVVLAGIIAAGAVTATLVVTLTAPRLQRAAD